MRKCLFLSFESPFVFLFRSLKAKNDRFVLIQRELFYSTGKSGLWSPTVKACCTSLMPEWGDIPAKSWRIHPPGRSGGLSAAGVNIIFGQV